MINHSSFSNEGKADEKLELMFNFILCWQLTSVYFVPDIDLDRASRSVFSNSSYSLFSRGRYFRI